MMTTKNSVKTRVSEFIKWHSRLMQNAPEGYTPWLFPVNANNKDPDGLAIAKRAPPDIKEGRGSWKSQWARLSFEEAITRLKEGGNVGVSARADDPLVLIDIDHNEYVHEMPHTLTTRSRTRFGLHGFCFTNDKKCKVNIPCDIEGEVRANDQYVVAPGSYVPTSEKDIDGKITEGCLEASRKEEILNDTNLGLYTLCDDRPPLNITWEYLPGFFQEQVRKTEPATEYNNNNNNNNKEFDKSKLHPLYQIVFRDIFKKPFVQSHRYPHPLHESDTGKNFSIDHKTGYAHCWRHLVSLTPLQFLVVKSGFMTCLEAGNGHKRASKSKAVGNPSAHYHAWKEAQKMGVL